MATYTIEPPYDSAGFTFDHFTGAARPTSAYDNPVGDIVGAARNVSADAAARFRSAYDENPARTFLVAVASLIGLVAVITSLTRS